MAIADFPTDLQDIIQQNMLEREFYDSLESRLAYRQICEQETFLQNAGETITKTRTGLLNPITDPINPATNTNLNNGLTPENFSVEQYTMTLNMYGSTTDLNVITQKVGIKNRFLRNARAQGIQALQSLDRIARNTLFNTYMGGNTRVTETLGAPGVTIKVDDVRQFNVIVVNGKAINVSVTNPLPVVVGADEYNLVGVAIDVVNTSTAFLGQSGTLTFSANVSVANGTLGNAVISQYAPVILRPNLRATTRNLVASDLLDLQIIRDAVAYLRNNNVPTVDGRYNCYLDFTSLNQLYADPEFQLLFRGEYNAKEYKDLDVIELLDVRYIKTTEAPQQSIVNAASDTIKVHRPIICGEGTLLEGQFEGLTDAVQDMGDNGESEIVVRDSVAMVVRPPLDRFRQIVAQSWYAINGYVVPTDVTATTDIIPTASDAYWKRAVLLEVGGA